MTSLKSDIVGRVNRLPLRPTEKNALLPLMEAISNSIDSITERMGDRASADGRVVVRVVRDMTAEGEPVIGFDVEDKMYRDDYLSETRNDPELKGKRLHFNDLRGTAVTLLAEAGCTIPEIVSITGHTLQSATRILEKYLARTKTLSDAAMIKFENAPAADFANRLQTTLVR